MTNPKKTSFAFLGPLWFGVMLLVGACNCGAAPGMKTCSSNGDCAAGFTCIGGVCDQGEDGGARGGGAGGGGGTDAGCSANLAIDVNNCGACLRVCPAPANAAAVCRAGACGRGPCAVGFFDLDGPQTLGCEASCANKVCNDGRGNALTVTNDPVPESGDAWRALSSGSSQGGLIQTSAGYTNLATLGEATSAPGGQVVEMTSPSFRNHGGFNAAFTK